MLDLINSMLNTSIYIAGILMMLGAVFTGIALPLAMLWAAISYLYKSGKAFMYLPGYVRHRKAFKVWYKQAQPNVIVPKLKQDHHKPYSELDYHLAKQKKLDLDDWNDYCTYFGLEVEDFKPER